MIDMRQHAVDEYLRRLERSMADLPAARRAEIVSEIHDHIQDALARLPEGASEADVRNVLEGIGDPDEIASEARADLGIAPSRRRWTDIAAVILLPVGGIVFPVVGWVVGVVFLWMSTVWTTREKLIGTFIVPGGLLLPLGLALTPVQVSSCSSIRGPGGTSVLDCPTDTSIVNILGIVIAVALFVTPIVVAVYLGRKLRQRTALRSIPDTTAGQLVSP